MGKALSVDLRVRVIDAIGAGMSRRAAATRFGISVVTAVRWAQRCCQANAKGLRLGCGRGETHSRSGYV